MRIAMRSGRHSTIAPPPLLLCCTVLAVLIALPVRGELPIAEGKRESSASADPKKPKAPSGIEVRIASWKDAQARIAAYRGKVVVLDVWTTTCGDCVKQFPDFVGLHRKYGDLKPGSSGVACISFNCDYDGVATKPPEFYRPQVLRFLEKHGAGFENLMSNVALADLLEGGVAEMPAVYVYGRDGKLARRFDNENAKSAKDTFTYADVSRLVDELLKD